MLKSYYHKHILECGCDEAGRGCLAGPVFAAAVILPKNFEHPDLNDSKKLTAAKREELRKVIESEAITYSVTAVRPFEIDQINILNASFAAMTRSVLSLKTTPELVLVDGNQFVSSIKTPHQCIIKGDSKYASIAAASILAKTYRDEFMCRIDERYPQYLWYKNKGYPTEEHRYAIIEHGVTIHHRKTFTLNDRQLRLFENDGVLKTG